jgi:hypothetical protein
MPEAVKKLLRVTLNSEAGDFKIRDTLGIVGHDAARAQELPYVERLVF